MISKVSPNPSITLVYAQTSTACKELQASCSGKEAGWLQNAASARMSSVLGTQTRALGNLPISRFGFCKEDLLVVHPLHLPTLIRDAILLPACVLQRGGSFRGEGGAGKYPPCFPCILDRTQSRRTWCLDLRLLGPACRNGPRTTAGRLQVQLRLFASALYG